MDIPLTQQQLQAIDVQPGGLPRLVDPRNNVAYVLLPETEYETVREILEDEARQRGIRAVALRNAGRRMDE